MDRVVKKSQYPSSFFDRSSSVESTGSESATEGINYYYVHVCCFNILHVLICFFLSIIIPRVSRVL